MLLWWRLVITAAAAVFNGGGGGVVAAAIGLLEWRCGGVSAAAFRRCCSNVYDGESKLDRGQKNFIYFFIFYVESNTNMYGSIKDYRLIKLMNLY